MDSERFSRLLKKVKSNSRAFTTLYYYFFPKIVVHINNKFKHRELGDDVAQEFFRNLLYKIEIPDKVIYPLSWVNTLCDNIALNMISKQKRETKTNDTFFENLPYQAFEQETYGEFCDSLKLLEPEKVKIITMHLFEGYGFKEIAQIIDINYDYVRQKYVRGLKKLKKILKECHNLPF